MHEDDHDAFCCCFCVAIVIAVCLTLGTVTTFPDEQREFKSFWKTECKIVGCFDAYAHSSRVTFQSFEYFEKQIEATLKGDCTHHAIGSTRKCYVNADSLTLDKPGGVGGIILLAFTCAFALVAVIIAGFWIYACSPSCTNVHQNPTIPSPAPTSFEMQTIPVVSNHVLQLQIDEKEDEDS